MEAAQREKLLNRKIIHIDMDAFFAAVEQLDHPEWRGKPVIVGGRPEQRGVVSTASYEARKYGIHSAMPAKTARRLCPNGIFTDVNFKRYREVSHRIREIFREVTGLTASAGVSFNKFLAKVASDWRKPAGLTVITPSRAKEFLFKLPIEKFYGVGAATAKHFHEIKVFTGEDLYKLDRSELVRHFGKVGLFYYNIVRGIDFRPVEPRESRKSLGKEITLAHDLGDVDALNELLKRLAAKVAQLLAREKLAGRTVTVKVRYDDFSTIGRSITLLQPVAKPEALTQAGTLLLSRTEVGTRKVRLLGLSVSGFPENSDWTEKQPELPLQWQDGI